MGWFCGLPWLSAIVSGCLTAAAPAPAFVGYVEGDYVLVAPREVGTITSVLVQRGQAVRAGDLLAEIDDRSAVLALRDSEARLAEAKANLADLESGRRPEEIQEYEANLSAAKATLADAEATLERKLMLRKMDVGSGQEEQIARTAADIARSKVAEYEARLLAAKLPPRPHALAAAQQRVEQATAALRQAELAISQRRLVAPASGIIDQVIRLPGEVASPSAPVVSLLAHDGRKVRFFVPQASLGTIAVGRPLDVSCDGCNAGYRARVTYVANSPEFTPPVLFSTSSRSRLVFLVEARLADESAPPGPGQIVDLAVASEGALAARVGP